MMPNIALVAGSPAAASRSTAILEFVQTLFAERRIDATLVNLRELPADALRDAEAHHPEIAHALQAIADADGVVLATSIRQSAYSGLLKSFLDTLPRDAFQGKVVLPVAIGSSPGHLIALDQALRPVLHGLGARTILAGLYLTEAQIGHPIDVLQVDPFTERRIRETVESLAHRWRAPRNSFALAGAR